MKPVWSGAISFGLIYIPVRLYNASESQDLDFDMLRRGDQCRIRYARVCRETGEEVPYEDIVKGYEYKKGEYVVLEDEDFKRANVRKTQTIEIMSFVDAVEIDEKYLEKPYYLQPTKEAQKAYALLRESLKKSGKVGIARYMMRTRERIGMLKAEDNALVLDQMRYASEIRAPDELNLPDKERVAPRELEMAIKLITQLTEPWDPQQYRDTYVDDLKKIIKAKVEGKLPEPEKEEPIPVDVTDLFAKLTQSLEMARGGGDEDEEDKPEPAHARRAPAHHGNGHNGHKSTGHSAHTD